MRDTSAEGSSTSAFKSFWITALKSVAFCLGRPWYSVVGRLVDLCWLHLGLWGECGYLKVGI